MWLPHLFHLFIYFIIYFISFISFHLFHANLLIKQLSLLPSIFSFLQSLCECSCDSLRFYVMHRIPHMQNDLQPRPFMQDSPPEDSPDDAIPPNIQDEVARGIKQLGYALGGSWACLYAGLSLPLI
jgi:hypothetical protein